MGNEDNAFFFYYLKYRISIKLSGFCFTIIAYRKFFVYIEFSIYMETNQSLKY